MSWMFWKKDGQIKKLPGPKSIPQSVGMHLVVKAKMSPDLVWNLKAVVVPTAADRYVYDVRIYDNDEVNQAGVKVIDYHSLDDHLNLVIFDGWYNDACGIVGKRD